MPFYSLLIRTLFSLAHIYGSDGLLHSQEKLVSCDNNGTAIMLVLISALFLPAFKHIFGAMSKVVLMTYRSTLVSLNRISASRFHFQ
jgi:hypothetical protein